MLFSSVTPNTPPQVGHATVESPEACQTLAAQAKQYYSRQDGVKIVKVGCFGVTDKDEGQ